MADLRKLNKYASVFKDAILVSEAFEPGKAPPVASNVDVWARGIVEEAFEKVFGRKPTLAEAQLAQAVGKLESGYGSGWREGKGKGSNNWGAVQYPKGQGEGKPGFMHEDSIAKTKDLPKQVYVAKFKSYPSAVDGAADMIRIIYKTTWGAHELTPPRMMPTGKAVAGSPGRGDWCLKAAADGDIMEFSSAMYHTSYYGGFAETFSGRIRQHAKTVEAMVRRISAALKEEQAVTIKSQNTLPITTDQEYIQRLLKNDPNAGGSQTPAQTPANAATQEPEQEIDQVMQMFNTFVNQAPAPETPAPVSSLPTPTGPMRSTALPPDVKW